MKPCNLIMHSYAYALLQSSRNGNLQQEKFQRQNFQNGQAITAFRYFGTKWNPKRLLERRNDIKKEVFEQKVDTTCKETKNF